MIVQFYPSKWKQPSFDPAWTRRWYGTKGAILGFPIHPVLAREPQASTRPGYSDTASQIAVILLEVLKSWNMKLNI